MFSVGVFLAPEDARADDQQVCVAAADRAQELRDAAHLVEARLALLTCAKTECPRIIRSDCAHWLDEVVRSTPTIVIRGRHADVNALQVFVDGELFQRGLDGKPRPIDPGTHTFRFELPDTKPETQTVVIFAGEHDRMIAAPSDELAKEPDARSRAGSPAVTASGGQSTPAAPGSAQKTIAYVLGGAGVVGVGLGVALGVMARSTYLDASSAAHCPTGPSSCDDVGISGGRDAHSLATGATIASVAGLVLLAGGVVFYLTAPRSAATASVRAQPPFRAGAITTVGSW
jgi:hypothetical protein